MSNLAKQSSDLTPLKTSKNKLIDTFEKPKIYSLSDDEPIRSVLKYIFVLIGLRNIPSKEEFSVLIHFIKNNYSVYSVDEIRLAFELAQKKEFIVDLNHYDLFSAQYLSNVLNAYSEYRERIAKEYMIKKQRKEQIENQNKEVTPEQKEKARKEFFENLVKPMFKTYKETERLVLGYLSINDIYESLRDDYNLIQLNASEQTRIKDEVKDEFENALKVSRAKNENKSKKEVWQELCRKKAIELSFDKIDELCG